MPKFSFDLFGGNKNLVEMKGGGGVETMMKRFVVTFPLGLVSIAAGCFLLSHLPEEPVMKEEPLAIDDEGHVIYTLVPCDKVEKQKSVERDAVEASGAWLVFLGACMTVGLLAQCVGHIAFEVRHRSSKVFVRDAGEHFHAKDCPRLTRVLWVSSSWPVPQGVEPCPLCNPLPSKGESGVFATIAGQHFHREGCKLFPKIRSMTRKEALATGFKPCRECGLADACSFTSHQPTRPPP